MANFSYKAMDAKGVATSGEVEGDNKAAVASVLRNRGLTVVDLNEVKTGISQFDILAPLQTIKGKDLTIFSRQFATMINAGLAMLRALTVLEEQTENPKLAKVIGMVRADVEAGIALSDALEKHPKVFSRLYTSMVRAGEIGGVLDEVLNRLAEQLEKDDNIKRIVKSAMIYPILIAVFAIVVLFGMVLFLIPVFAKMFADMGGKLPLLTRIMMTASEYARDFPLNILIFGSIIGFILGIRKLKRTDRGTMVWDRTKLHLPMGVGDIVRKMAVARFSRTLGTLISSGVPILQAIEITGRSAGNVVIENAMASVQIAVKEGQTISGPLAEAKVFPEMVVQMLSVGEETGSLDHMLSKVADFYESEVDASVKALTSIIEPIMMMGVGALVGTVVISMYLPIFNIMKIVK
jgi:type IV pilus assembly protein PilC